MKRLAWGLIPLVLAGCSSLNPFSDKKGPPPLPALNATATINTVWSASVGAPGNYALQPAVLDQAVFVASEKGDVTRLEAGREVWRVRSEGGISAGVGVGAGRLAVASAKGDVQAYDLDGKALWRAKVSSEVLAVPALTDTLVLVRTVDNRIHALDARDGTRRWVYQRSSPALVLRSSAGVTVSDGVAYAGFPGGKLVALNLANGAALWESTIALPRGATELERVADISSDPLIYGRAVCAAAFQGRLACVDRMSGTNLWSREISSASGLAIDRRTLYLTDDKGNIFAFDAATGATMWKQDQLAGRSPSRPAAAAGGVWVVDVEGWRHFLRANDGSIKARVDGKPAASAPVPFNDAALVQDTGGGVRAYSAQ